VRGRESRMDRMVETRVKVRLAFVSIFILGIAAGVLGVSIYYGRIDPGRPSGGTGRFDRERYVKQMTEAVGLQPEQMGALNAVLDETREEFLALRARLRPQFDEVRQRARVRIRGILNADQQGRFEAFVKRWDEERRAEEQAASGAKAERRAP
jgi:hypothetical protein